MGQNRVSAAGPGREELIAANPGNAGCQRDLSVSHNKFGDVWVAQGDLPQALEVAQALSDTRRLDPADHWMIGNLKKRIAALPDD